MESSGNVRFNNVSLRGEPGEVVTVDNSPELPGRISLQQIYPKSFNPITVIQYELPTTTDVSLAVYDMLGRKIAMLVEEQKNSGIHMINFNASHLSSGVYLYKLSAGETVEIKKMTLIK